MVDLCAPDLQHELIAGGEDAEAVAVGQQVVAFEPGNSQRTTAFDAAAELDEDGSLDGGTAGLDHETGIAA